MGYFILPIKYGNKEEIGNGRFFNYYDESSFGELLKRHPYFSLIEMKVTSDVRKGRENEKWLNVQAYLKIRKMCGIYSAPIACKVICDLP
ncbi:MAG: hypothetical protein PWP45_1543 [Tepidanaerobacteraceae bacterium]|nr:hypothetical protein [Tepidanaerobacteraceae bacterium]